MAGSNTAIVLARVAAWNQANPHAQLDPQAVLAVASAEGLGGGIGDQGTSWGPFQLHRGGAFPSGVAPAGQEQAWAWSPAGIDYALRHIASVAGGQSGAQAVSSIVNRFERPANPQAEITRALGRTQMAAPRGVQGLQVPAQGVPSNQPDISPIVAALIAHRTPQAPFVPKDPVFPSIAPLAAQTPVPLGAPVPAMAFRTPQLSFPTNGPSLFRPLAGV